MFLFDGDASLMGWMEEVITSGPNGESFAIAEQKHGLLSPGTSPITKLVFGSCSAHASLLKLALQVPRHLEEFRYSEAADSDYRFVTREIALGLRAQRHSMKKLIIECDPLEEHAADDLTSFGSLRLCYIAAPSRSARSTSRPAPGEPGIRNGNHKQPSRFHTPCIPYST